MDNLRIIPYSSSLLVRIPNFTDKKGVLQHCYNLLEEGGEFYFSDVYANRRVPQSLQDDPVLWGECLVGLVKLELHCIVLKNDDPC